jgi:hypothetical protein
MSRQRHPDTEELARHQAGLIGGFRGRRLAAHLAGCTRCASLSEQLAAVGPVLASVPATPMPDAVERQITAAIAAEAATRQAATQPGATQQAATEQAGERQAAARPAGPRRPRTHGFRPAMAAIPAAACLLLAGLGYLLSQTGSSTSSSATGTAGASAPLHAASRAAGAAGAASAPSMGLRPQSSGLGAPFAVIASGTSYQKATLGTQVLGVLDGKASKSPATYSNSTAGNGSASSSAAGSSPSPALKGCVLHLTGNARPRLVDRATYAGERAYVIVVANRVLVVGLGCTASHPDLITSAALPQ